MPMGSRLTPPPPPLHVLGHLGEKLLRQNKYVANTHTFYFTDRTRQPSARLWVWIRGTWTDLSRDEAAKIGVDIFHESHVEQREACLHSSQDISMTCKWMVSPLRFSPTWKKKTIQDRLLGVHSELWLQMMKSEHSDLFCFFTLSLGSTVVTFLLISNS